MPVFSKIDANTNTVLSAYYVTEENVENKTYPESESIGVEFLSELNEPNTYWKQTSPNGEFRANYGGIGFIYNPERDAFVPPAADLYNNQFVAPEDNTRIVNIVKQ
jgi:hypothetical protein